MLEAEPERECETEDFREWVEITVIGEVSVEYPRELYEDVEIGESNELQSAGSVTLLGTVGRTGYGVKPGGLRVLDRTLRCPRLGPTVDEGSMIWSWVRILGNNAGPLCRVTGDRLGVVKLVMTESGDELEYRDEPEVLRLCALPFSWSTASLGGVAGR